MSAALRELVPVRIPMEGGDHEAVIVVERDGDLEGIGEAPVVPGGPGSLDGLIAELASGRPRSPAALCALETAGLDLEARRRRKPLAALRGGAPIAAAAPPAGSRRGSAAARPIEVSKLEPDGHRSDGARGQAGGGQGADLAFGAGLGGPRLELPAGPGLGVELDRRVLELYRLDR